MTLVTGPGDRKSALIDHLEGVQSTRSLGAFRGYPRQCTVARAASWGPRRQSKNLNCTKFHSRIGGPTDSWKGSWQLSKGASGADKAKIVIGLQVMRSVSQPHAANRRFNFNNTSVI